MRKLYVEFTRPKGFKPFSYLIRAVECTPYSHVRLRWVNTTGVNLVYEASGSSVKFLGPKAQPDVDVIHTFEFDIDKTAYRRLIQVCMTYAGIRYSISQAIKIGLLSWGIGKGRFTKDGEYAQVCSELVVRVMEKVFGIDLAVDEDTSGPKKLYQELKQVTDKGQ